MSREATLSHFPTEQPPDGLSFNEGRRQLLYASLGAWETCFGNAQVFIPEEQEGFLVPFVEGSMRTFTSQIANLLEAVRTFNPDPQFATDPVAHFEMEIAELATQMRSFLTHRAWRSDQARSVPWLRQFFDTLVPGTLAFSQRLTQNFPDSANLRMVADLTRSALHGNTPFELPVRKGGARAAIERRSLDRPVACANAEQLKTLETLGPVLEKLPHLIPTHLRRNPGNNRDVTEGRIEQLTRDFEQTRQALVNNEPGARNRYDAFLLSLQSTTRNFQNGIRSYFSRSRGERVKPDYVVNIQAVLQHWINRPTLNGAPHEMVGPPNEAPKRDDYVVYSEVYGLPGTVAEPAPIVQKKPLFVIDTPRSHPSETPSASHRIDTPETELDEIGKALLSGTIVFGHGDAVLVEEERPIQPPPFTMPDLPPLLSSVSTARPTPVVPVETVAVLPQAQALTRTRLGAWWESLSSVQKVAAVGTATALAWTAGLGVGLTIGTVQENLRAKEEAAQVVRATAEAQVGLVRLQNAMATPTENSTEMTLATMQVQNALTSLAPDQRREVVLSTGLGAGVTWALPGEGGEVTFLMDAQQGRLIIAPFCPLPEDSLHQLATDALAAAEDTCDAWSTAGEAPAVEQTAVVLPYDTVAARYAETEGHSTYEVQGATAVTLDQALTAHGEVVEAGWNRWGLHSRAEFDRAAALLGSWTQNPETGTAWGYETTVAVMQGLADQPDRDLALVMNTLEHSDPGEAAALKKALASTRLHEGEMAQVNTAAQAGPLAPVPNYVTFEQPAPSDDSGGEDSTTGQLMPSSKEATGFDTVADAWFAEGDAMNAESEAPIVRTQQSIASRVGGWMKRLFS